MLEVKINQNDAGQRLDKFLSKTFPELKKSMMYKAIRNKKIKVNRKRCEHNQFLEEGDKILLFLPLDMLVQNKEKAFVLNTKPIDIVYEDEHILVVNKPAGLLSQKDSTKDQDTLNDRIVGYLIQSGQYNPKAEQSFTPSICHRLDRNTTGLVIAAKSSKGARLVNDAIAQHQIQKEYLALCSPKPQTGDYDLWLKKEGTKAVVKNAPMPGFQEAKMSVSLVEQNQSKALVRVQLETGRFHQIRACMAYMGTPLCGDHKYGGSKEYSFQQLQAYKIDFSQANLPFGPKEIVLPFSKQLSLNGQNCLVSSL